MRWWMENGYDMTAEATKNRDVKAWIKATGNLTRNLRQNYDAVWFLGKGIRKLLDGDQVCVYNTKLICVVEPKLATGLEIGAKVTHTQQLRDDYVGRNVLYVDDLKPDDFRSAGNLAGKGWRGVYRADTEDSDNKVGRYPIHFIPPPGMVGTIVEKRGESFDVKWQVGGVRYNYHASELEPFKR